MTKTICGTVALLALALSAPASAQTIIVEEAPRTETYTYAPGTLRYYRAPRRLYNEPRRFHDEDDASRTANEISPNETGAYYRQMEQEGRAGGTQ